MDTNDTMLSFAEILPVQYVKTQGNNPTLTTMAALGFVLKNTSTFLSVATRQRSADHGFSLKQRQNLLARISASSREQSQINVDILKV